MSLILRRQLAKQKLEEPEGMTAEELLDKLYELIDSNELHKNAKITFNMIMYAVFICENCSYHNQKAYDKHILNWQVDEKNSTYERLIIYIK